MEMMIALNFSFREDQNRPKDHQILRRESVLMKKSPHAHLDKSAIKQIGHSWKPINTSDLKLIWTSPSIFFFSFSLIGSHKSKAGTTKEVRKSLKL